MKKFKEIKEIKKDIKVKEIKKEPEDIEDLTSDEIPVSETEAETISSRPVVSTSQNSVQHLPVQPVRTAPPPAQRAETESGVRLYDVGRGLGNESEGRRRYIGQAQQVADMNSRTVKLGGSPALVNTGIQDRNTVLDDRAADRKYGPESSEKPKRKVGPWE